VLDLPREIVEKPDAAILNNVQGITEFQDVSFRYGIEQKSLLKKVRRFGQLQEVRAVSSGDEAASTYMEENGKGDNNSVQSQARDEVLEHISFRAEPGSWWRWSAPAGLAKRLSVPHSPSL
jgi:ATP-binding cassette subfamily B protein